MTKIRNRVSNAPLPEAPPPPPPPPPLSWDALPPPPEPLEPNAAGQKKTAAFLGYDGGPRAGTRRVTPSPLLLKPLPPQFDPLKDIRWEKDGHVINPNAVRFDLIYYDEKEFYIVLRHGDEKLGQIKMQERPFGENMCMVTSGLEPQAQGRRLGALLYLVVADLVREQGLTLGSDSRLISPEAVHVWQNLQRRGLAKPGTGWVNDWSIDNAALAKIAGPARAFFAARASEKTSFDDE